MFVLLVLVLFANGARHRGVGNRYARVRSRHAMGARLELVLILLLLVLVFELVSEGA